MRAPVRVRRSSPPAETSSGQQPLLELAGAVIGLLIAVYLVGLIVTWVRFSAARLPAGTVDVLGPQQLFGAGLRSTLLTSAAFAVLCGLAYLLAGFRWDVNRQDWHDIVRKRGVGQARSAAGITADPRQRKSLRRARRSQTLKPRYERLGALSSRHPRLERLAAFSDGRAAKHAERLDSAGVTVPPLAEAPLGDAAVRIVAGFNLMVLAGLLSLAIARGVEKVAPTALLATLGSSIFLVVWAVFFLVFHQLFTRVDPLRLGPRWHGLPWVVIVVGLLLASAPIGVLVLTGVVVSTAGRAVARLPRLSSLAIALRSPLPWILLGVITLLALADQAMPPVSFPEASVSTATAAVSGGYLRRTPSGVYLITCTGLADATSTDERVRFVRVPDRGSVTVGGGSVNLDSGERPSLLTLGLRAVGVDGVVHPLFNADLRPRQGTCGGATSGELTGAVPVPALGAGVLGEPPGTTPTPAHDGEAPIEQQNKTPPAIAALARRYQPTLLVTIADRFWPVSVNALLADRGPHGGPTCLIRQDVKPVCGAQLSAQNLAASGSRPSDYLQFPVRLTHDPKGVGQFHAFENGQYINTGRLHTWLRDPGRLRPWYTAQMYFYLGRPVSFSKFPPPATSLPEGKPGATYLPLEYWFYYPDNYFPLLTTSALMNQAPLAGDVLNVDLHQGDWEHIDVLLNPQTRTPEWLYMARHSGEGQFIQWGSPSLALDAGHPLVQAALGGHPTYEPGCGPQIRNQPASVLQDWLVCGSGRFAFRAASTPLVDMAWMPWACWPGHFGAAGTRDEINSVGKREGVLDLARGQLFVAGPQAPVRQAENAGTCSGNPATPELTANGRYFARAPAGSQKHQINRR